MKDLSDLDLDDEALVKKTRPWGWFAAGLVLLLALTFAGAYALPLSTAHETLAKQHEELAKKASELDKAFISTKKRLEETEEQRRSLEKKITDVEDARKSLSSRLEAASATASGSMQSIMKANLAEISTTGSQVTLTVENRALFLPRSAKMNGSMGGLLCKVIESADKTWNVDVAIGFQTDEKDAWKDAGEKAAALGDLLSTRCKLEDFVVGARPAAEGKGDDSTVFSMGPEEIPALPMED